MNLKPFNLQEALANPERVVTRDGRKVTQLTKFQTFNSHCIYAVIDGILRSFDKMGLYHDGCESKLDLFLLPQTKTVWVVIIQTKDYNFTSLTFETDEKAKEYIIRSNYKIYSKPTPIEIEI